MVRMMIAVGAGYFSITALNSFIHLIISIYAKSNIVLTGIANMPSSFWVVTVVSLQWMFGLFAGFLTTTLAKKNYHIVILALIMLMVIISLLDYSILSEREPLWYLITSPVLRITGIFTGYKLQLKQLNPTSG